MITLAGCDLTSAYSSLSRYVSLGLPSQAVSLQDLALAFPALLLKSTAAEPGEPGEGLGTIRDGDTLDPAPSTSSVVQSEHREAPATCRSRSRRASLAVLLDFLLDHAWLCMAWLVAFGWAAAATSQGGGTGIESGLLPSLLQSFFSPTPLSGLLMSNTSLWLRSPSMLVSEMTPDSGGLALATGVRDTHPVSLNLIMSPFWLGSPLGVILKPVPVIVIIRRLAYRAASGLKQQRIKSQSPLIVSGPAAQGTHAGACTDLCLFFVRPWGRVCTQDSLGSSAIKHRQGCSMPRAVECAGSTPHCVWQSGGAQ